MATPAAKYRLVAIPKLVFLLWLFASTSAVASAEVKVRAAIEPVNPVVNQTTRLIVRVEGDQNVGEPQLPNMEAFQKLSSSTSTSVSISNGVKRVTREYVYRLVPTRAGSYKLSPIYVNHKGSRIASNALEVTISEAPQSSGNLAERASQPYFATAKLSKKRAFVGEQIVYTVKFYYRVQVSDLQLTDLESDRFWIEGLGEVENSVENIGSEPFRLLIIRKALYAKRPGEFDLPPAVFDFYAIRGRRGTSRGIFDRMFNDPFLNVSRREPVSIVSNREKLTVLALPKEGQPANFSGLVGSLNLSLTSPPSASSVEQGSSITLTTRLSGSVNLKGDLSLDWQSQDKYKTYEDKPVDKSRVVNQQGRPLLVQERTFKTAVVPLRPGELTLGPIEFSYFDPNSATYKKVTSDSIALTVTPSALSGLPTAPTVTTEPERETRSTVTALGKDILPNHRGRKLLTQHSLYPFSPVNIALFLLPLLLGAATLLVERRLQRRGEVAQLERRNKAAKRAKKELRKLGKQQEIDKQLGNKLYEIYTRFLKERMDLPSGLIMPDELNRILGAEALSKEACQLLEELEALRLGLAIKSKTGNRSNWPKRISRTIVAIDRHSKVQT